MNLLALEESQRIRIESLFLATSDLDPPERNRYLDRECRGDTVLRQQVNALLAADARSNVVVGQFAKRLGVTALAELHHGAVATTQQPGSTYGPYRLLREIGHGGMGAVWLADRVDGLVKRPVALKLPTYRLGAGFDDRFARERDALAALSHPNIARLYDAGVSAEGHPYLALEYIDGQHIDAYCDARSLAVPQKLQLFLKIARAVAFAHTKLIVHRDLKPSNILVTVDGEPVLVDFGIAKLLDADLESGAQATLAGVAPMTPDYASPEQMAGRSITTATDIYSLGVVLFQLLAGCMPKGTDTHERQLSEPKLMTEMVADGPLKRAFRGDLDTIVHKALKEAPDERYLTVDAFADDIERHLAGQVVRARPDSRWYRANRFLRRHRLAVGASAAVVAAVLAGAAVALWQAKIARDEALYAERTTDFLLSTFNAVDPAVARGETVTARQLVDQAAASVGTEFEDAPLVRARMMVALGTVYTKLGEYAEAERMIRGGLALQRSGLDRADDELVESLNQLGATLSLKGDSPGAREAWQEIIDRTLDDAEPNLRARYHLAVDFLRRDELVEGTRRLETNAKAWERRFGLVHERTLAALSSLGTGYRLMGRLETAAVIYERILEPFKTVFGADHPHTIGQTSNTADLYVALHRETDARPLYEEALKRSRRVNGESHPHTGRIGMNLANLYRRSGDLAAAEVLYEQTLTVRREAVGDRHPETISHLSFLGSLKLAKGELDTAESIQRQALALADGTLTADHRYAMQPLQGLIDVLNARENLDPAAQAELEQLTARWLTLLAGLAEAPAATLKQRYDYGLALATCVPTSLRRVDEARAIAAQLADETVWRPYALLLLAHAEEHEGRSGVAASHLVDALALLPDQPSELRRTIETNLQKLAEQPAID